MLTYSLFAMTMSLAPVAEPHTPQPASLNTSPFTSQHTAQHRDSQKELLEFATTTQESHGHFASVWPGFWNENTPFITFNYEGEAVLFTQSEPIPGYQKLEDNYYFYSERLPNLTDFTFHINYPVSNGEVATAIRLGSDESSADLRDTLLHEAFHGYQKANFADVGRSEFIDPKHIEEVTVRAMLQLQLALAKQAHESREVAHIRDWLMVRAALSEAIAPEVASYLGDVERIEGTANWVGIRASFAEHYRDKIDSFFYKFPGQFETTHALRSSAYITGALLIDVINDFSDPDNDWRHAIEQGETPYEVAVHLFDISSEEATAQLNDVIAQYDFSEYLARAQVTQSDLVTLEDIAASYPYRLDVTVSVVMDDGRIELPMHFSGGEAGFHQLETSLIFLPFAETLQLTHKDSRIDVRNVPALVDMRNAHDRGATLSFWSQAPMITMDALNGMRDLDLQFGESVIQSPAGWTLDPTSTNEHLRIIF